MEAINHTSTLDSMYQTQRGLPTNLQNDGVFLTRGRGAVFVCTVSTNKEVTANNAMRFDQPAALPWVQTAAVQVT